MKTLIKVFFISLLFGLTQLVTAQTAGELLLQAEDFEDQVLSLSLSQKALELANQTNDKNSIISAKTFIALAYFYQNRIDEGETLLNEALQMAQNNTDLLVQYRCWNMKGALNYFKGNYEQGIICFEKAYSYALKMGDAYYNMDALISLAECNLKAGKTETALEKCAQALKVTMNEHAKRRLSAAYLEMGFIYETFSNKDKAIENYEQALKIYEATGNRLKSAYTLQHIAANYMQNDYNKVIEYTLRAIPIFNEFNLKPELIDCHFRLALSYVWLGGKQAEALNAVAQVKNLARELNGPYWDMHAIFADAFVNFDYGQETINKLLKGYAIAKDLNDVIFQRLYENYIGIYYDINDNYTGAVDFYKSMVEKDEKNRLTVPDDLKLAYWSNSYVSYSNLIRCQLYMKDYTGCINSIEKSTARILLERMAKKSGNKLVQFSDVSVYNKNIPQDQAIIYFGNLGNDLNILIVTNSSTEGISVNDGMWAQSVKNRYTLPDVASNENLRAFKKMQSKTETEVAPVEKQEKKQIYDETKRSIEIIVNNYRLLLSKSTNSPTEIETLNFLSKKLYQLLIKPIESKLNGKTELLIIPTDILAFLPFETLIMTDGSYLVEKYDIRYLPSYSVGTELANRKYPVTRKPMLAFGNAIYNGSEADNRAFKKTSGEDQAITPASQARFAELMKGVEESAKKGENMKKYYDALGYLWDNLPGTQAELDAIASLLPSSTIIKGTDVNKKNIIQMSQKGLLKNYKIIHFATHGLVIPEFQELSAIVLSQGQPNDDGYLRASEVANLNLNADFVNLSACETGLGKIYEGEGVVGLTQSILLAGANSVAVSLWQVNDLSTMEFQKEMYRLVFNEKMPVSKAINQVKRTFIKGQYKQPFYWAPFVYYGF